MYPDACGMPRLRAKRGRASARGECLRSTSFSCRVLMTLLTTRKNLQFRTRQESARPREATTETALRKAANRGVGRQKGAEIDEKLGPGPVRGPGGGPRGPRGRPGGKRSGKGVNSTPPPQPRDQFWHFSGKNAVRNRSVFRKAIR